MDPLKDLLKIPVIGPVLHCVVSTALLRKKIIDSMSKNGELIVPPQKPMFQEGGIVEGGKTIDVTIPVVGGESWFNEEQFINLQKAIGVSEEDAKKEWFSYL